MSLRRVIVAVITIGCLIFGKYAYHAYRERQVMDQYTNAFLSAPFEAPLDCPPFGQLRVEIFPPENPDNAAEIDSEIVKRWAEFWSSAYPAILREATNDKVANLLSNNPSVEVDTPKDVLSANPVWSIHLDSAAGSYSANMKGSQMTSVSID